MLDHYKVYPRIPCSECIGQNDLILSLRSAAPRACASTRSPEVVPIIEAREKFKRINYSNAEIYVSVMDARFNVPASAALVASARASRA